MHKETNLSFQIGETNIHKDSGSSQFYVNYIGSLGGNMGSRSIKIDISRGETLCYDPEIRAIFADYSDMKDLTHMIVCHTLSEILIEKIAALMGRTERETFMISGISPRLSAWMLRVTVVPLSRKPKGTAISPRTSRKRC